MPSSQVQAIVAPATQLAHFLPEGGCENSPGWSIAKSGEASRLNPPPCRGGTSQFHAVVVGSADCCSATQLADFLPQGGCENSRAFPPGGRYENSPGWSIAKSGEGIPVESPAL